MRFLGVISYSLYLYHVWGLGVGHRLTFLPGALQLFAGVLASVVLAWGSYVLIEQRFLALKPRFRGLPPPALAAGPRVAALG